MDDTYQPRILCVDDNQSNLTLLARLLRSAGFTEVTTVDDAHDAVPTYRRIRPDLVLLDLHMPGRDGFDILDELRGDEPEGYVPIVVLTADANPDARDRALSAGASDFLTKPFDRTEVLLRIRNLLATRALHMRHEQRREQLEHQLRSFHADESRRRTEHDRRYAEVEQLMADPDAIVSVYQPILNLHSRKYCGAEALSRFPGDPARPPDHWFTQAAAVGLGPRLELHAARLALDAIDQLPGGIYVAVNLSPDALQQPELPDLIRPVAGRTVIELTEHAAVTDYDRLHRAVRTLRDLGARLSVDDTGAGFASLQHILSLKPDIIKLDRGLTTGVDRDPIRRALATSLSAFATQIGSTLVAEGVETGDELALLAELGVDCAQGFHIARPGPLPLPDVLAVATL